MTDKSEIRPNPGARVDGTGRCEDSRRGRDVVMWFRSRGKIKLTAEFD